MAQPATVALPVGEIPASQSDGDSGRRCSTPLLERARGRASVRLSCPDGNGTRLNELFQQGCLKIRLPRSQCRGEVDAVIINTSGGLTGGDAVSVTVHVERGGRAAVTTPGCERIYRSLAGDAIMDLHLCVGIGARIDWLPQETILFDGARLRRRFEIDLKGNAEVTLADAVVFGRAAMGERMKCGSFSDFWTIRRDDELIFADAMRICEPFEKAMDSAATLRGCRAMATLLHVGCQPHVQRDRLRECFDSTNEVAAGASVVGDVLAARIAGSSARAVRTTVMAALDTLRDGRPLPRSWFY